MEDLGTGVPGDAATTQTVVETKPAKKKRGRKPKDPAKAGVWAGKKKGSAEYKELDRQQAAERRDLRQDERDQASRAIDFPSDLFKKDIKRILVEERRIRPLIADQIVPLVQVAARAHDIPANWHLVRYGLKNTLAGTELGEIEEGVVVEGEVLFKHELECIHDFSLFRQPEISFDEFLAVRRNCKTDVMFLADLIGKNFHQSPHGKWTYEFFPRFNPDNLRPNYTQQEAREWVANQIDRHNTFLLLASRNAYKSTWAQVYVMSFVLCYPDALVILASETHDLSENLIGGLRQYFESVDESTPDKLLQFFPEYAVPVGEGSSMVYECPIRHLRLPAPTIRSISLDSSVAGGRFNLLVADDVLSDKSSGNEKQTKATTSRFDSLQKLGQANSSFTVVLGTPWSETPPDLYKTLKERAEADPDTKIAVRVDPIMEIKPHALKKKLTDLVEEDIESLLFPEVLDWGFIRAEIMRNPANTSFFESQNLCRFVPPAESKYKCNFEEDVLRSLVVYPMVFSGWTLLRTILSVDTSASASRYADMSALIICKLYEKSDGQRVLVVFDVDMDRYRPSDLAAHIAQMHYKHNPDATTIERCQLWQALEDKIEAEANKRGFSLRNKIHWREPGNSAVKGKAARIKNLEPLANSRRLLFAYHSSNEIVIQQFMHWDGIRRSGSADFSKDDSVDAIAMAAERVAGDLLQRLPPQKSEAELELEARMEGDRIRKAQYDRTFGNQQLPPNYQSRYEPSPTEEQNKLYRTLGQFNFVRPPRAA
jgi:hypothetical protein